MPRGPHHWPAVTVGRVSRGAGVTVVESPDGQVAAEFPSFSRGAGVSSKSRGRSAVRLPQVSVATLGSGPSGRPKPPEDSLGSAYGPPRGNSRETGPTRPAAP